VISVTTTGRRKSDPDAGCSQQAQQSYGGCTVLNGFVNDRGFNDAIARITHGIVKINQKTTVILPQNQIIDCLT